MKCYFWIFLLNSLHQLYTLPAFYCVYINIRQTLVFKPKSKFSVFQAIFFFGSIWFLQRVFLLRWVRSNMAIHIQLKVGFSFQPSNYAQPWPSYHMVFWISLILFLLCMADNKRSCLVASWSFFVPCICHCLNMKHFLICIFVNYYWIVVVVVPHRSLSGAASGGSTSTVLCCSTA